MIDTLGFIWSVDIFSVRFAWVNFTVVFCIEIIASSDVELVVQVSCFRDVS